MKSREQSDTGHFGYAQELFRNVGGFSSFAISFSIVSIITGVCTLYGYGLEMGGPLEMTLGWPIATLGTLTVAASMAELCSAYPTAGGTYHWASALGGMHAGWFVCVLNIVGATATLLGVDYSCAQFVLPFLQITSSARHLVEALIVILLLQALINHYGVRLVAWLNDFSVTVHIAGVLVVVAALFWFAPKQPVSFLLLAVNSNGQHFYGWAFLLGLLQAQWTYTGFDASAAIAEETESPRTRAPWGIFLAVAVSGVVGYVLVLAITLAISTIPNALHAVDAQGNALPAVIGILQGGLGVKAGNAMGGLAALAMWFCGLGSLTSTSRMLFSLARDNGTPFSRILRKVSVSHGTPAAAIWFIVAVAFCGILVTSAIPVITSMATVAAYLSYGLPILFAYRARSRGGQDWTREAVWTLGRYGRGLNLIAIFFAAAVCFIMVMPPNQIAGQMLAAVVALAVVLYGFVRRSGFRGPAWVGGKA